MTLLTTARIREHSNATIAVAVGFAVAVLVPTVLLTASDGALGAAWGWTIGNAIAAGIALVASRLPGPERRERRSRADDPLAYADPWLAARRAADDEDARARLGPGRAPAGGVPLRGTGAARPRSREASSPRGSAPLSGCCWRSSSSCRSRSSGTSRPLRTSSRTTSAISTGRITAALGWSYAFAPALRAPGARLPPRLPGPGPGRADELRRRAGGPDGVSGGLGRAAAAHPHAALRPRLVDVRDSRWPGRSRPSTCRPSRGLRPGSTRSRRSPRRWPRSTATCAGGRPAGGRGSRGRSSR